MVPRKQAPMEETEKKKPFEASRYFLLLGEESNSPKNKKSSSSSSMPCLRRVEDVRQFEETEDCFILEFDPTESISISNLNLDANRKDGDDVSIIAEKGQVACRDYPHSRHLCPRFPFKTIPDETHCDKCYCYVCDVAAPCKDWVLGTDRGHCHATERVRKWKDARRAVLMKRRSEELPTSSDDESSDDYSSSYSDED